MADAFEWPDDQTVIGMIQKRADALAKSERDGDEFAGHIKKLVVLAWHLLERPDRADFLDRCDPETNEFLLRPIDIRIILGAWWIVMENLPCGWDGEFAKSIDKRKDEKFWKPKGVQEQHIRRIFESAQRRHIRNKLRAPHCEVEGAD